MLRYYETCRRWRQTVPKIQQIEVTAAQFLRTLQIETLMPPVIAPVSVEESVRERVLSWTGRRVRGLVVVVRGKTVVLAGTASSFHVKQLAQRGAQEVLPATPLANEIVVESATR